MEKADTERTDTKRIDNARTDIEAIASPVLKEQMRILGELRNGFTEYFNTIVGLIPPGRPRSLALTKLEEALHWAQSGIVIETEEKKDESGD